MADMTIGPDSVASDALSVEREVRKPAGEELSEGPFPCRRVKPPCRQEPPSCGLLLARGMGGTDVN